VPRGNDSVKARITYGPRAVTTTIEITITERYYLIRQLLVDVTYTITVQIFIDGTITDTTEIDITSKLKNFMQY